MLRAQNFSDTKQILEGVNSKIVETPSKARDLIIFLKKYQQSESVVNQCNYFLVQSYYYENNYSEAFQNIIQTYKDQDVKGQILYKNILYSAGIKKVSFLDKFEKDSLFKINKNILKINDLIIENSFSKAHHRFVSVLPKINDQNKDVFRESLSLLVSNILERRNEKEYSQILSNVERIVNLYSNDAQFEVYKKELFPNQISSQWLLNARKIQENTTNVKLVGEYYKCIESYYYEKRDDFNIIAASDKNEFYFKKNNQDIIFARSQWIYLTENKRNEEFKNFQYWTYAILWVIFIVFIIVIILILFKIRQEKKKGIQYGLMSDKIKSISTKKKEPQTISENVKNVLLEKLEKLELTHFFLDPNISVQTLAKKLDSNSKYISDVINSSKNKNFTAYINGLRINYIKEKLYSDPVYRNYKIKYLAEECGFSSHSIFSSVFKNLEGVSPVHFIQQLKEDNL